MKQVVKYVKFLPSVGQMVIFDSKAFAIVMPPTNSRIYELVVDIPEDCEFEDSYDQHAAIDALTAAYERSDQADQRIKKIKGQVVKTTSAKDLDLPATGGFE